MNAQQIRHTLFRSIILFGFGIYLLKLLLSGEITNYIAPQMVKYAWFSTVVFLLLSIVLVLRTFGGEEEERDCCHTHVTHGRWKSLLVYGIFVIPLLFGFVLPEKPLDVSLVDKKGVNLKGVQQTLLPREGKQEANSSVNTSMVDTSGNDKEIGIEDDSEPFVLDQVEDTGEDTGNADSDSTTQNAAEQIDSFAGELEYYEQLAQTFLKQDVIRLTDETYLDGITAIEWYSDEMEGKKMQLYGFIYREPEMTADQFVVARYALSCCTADASVYGLLVHYPGASNWKDGTWVRITGTLKKTTYQDFEVMSLDDVTTIEKIDPPKDPYVYPSYMYDQQ